MNSRTLKIREESATEKATPEFSVSALRMTFDDDA